VVPEGELRPSGAPESTLRSVHVKGTLSAVSTEYVFRGRLTGTYERDCDRCLEPAQESADQEVTWLFEPGEEEAPGASDDADEMEVDVTEDEDRARYYHGEEIDLAPHVWEEMLLAAPTKFYCRDDCRGLCPQCGKNLNEGACDCAPEKAETSDSGLAALKDMFPNLPSKPVEE